MDEFDIVSSINQMKHLRSISNKGIGSTDLINE